MADENGDVGQAKLEDSNMANYGGKEMRDLRKTAAATDPELKGAGSKVGLEVWRVENKRTEKDNPDFGIKRWPKDQYGEFYTGDSYIVLNTYKAKDPETGKVTDALAWDVHFWLGNETSIDERGVAAYKTVEIDDLLDDGPVQHRETQEHESPLFQSYFGALQYLEGGIASGFRQVKPEEYEPRLFQVRRTRKAVRATQVPVKASSMNQGDVFILDTGLKVFLWIGDEANAFEKSKGGALRHNIIQGRKGKAKATDIEGEDEELFWKTLGGTEADVQSADAADREMDADVDPNNNVLFRISDASGSMQFSKEAEGQLKWDMLDSNDVFLVDAHTHLFVWIGKGATKSERNAGMTYADKYIESMGRPAHLPVTQVNEGQVNSVFRSCFAY